MQLIHHWRYKNTTLLVISLIVLFVLADTETAHAVIRHIGSYGYVGAFVAGIFFVSTFTVAPASLVLFHLAQEFNPVLIAVFAGAGGVIGDLLIFRFLRDGVFDELRPLAMKVGRSQISTLFHTPYFAWLAPVVGALIIASPFPDEIGVGLLGLSAIRLWQFVAITFVLNALGIFVIISLASAL